MNRELVRALSNGVIGPTWSRTQDDVINDIWNAVNIATGHGKYSI